MAGREEIINQTKEIDSTEGRRAAASYLFKQIRRNPTDEGLIALLVRLAGEEKGKEAIRILLADDPDNKIAERQLLKLEGTSTQSQKSSSKASSQSIMPMAILAGVVVIGLVLSFIILNLNGSTSESNREQLLMQARDEFVAACVQRFNAEQEDSSLRLQEDFLQSVCEDSFDEDISPNEDAVVDCQQQISPLDDFSAWDRCITAYIANSGDRFADPISQDTEADLTRTHIANQNATNEALIVPTATLIVVRETEGVYPTPTATASIDDSSIEGPTSFQFLPPGQSPSP